MVGNKRTKIRLRYSLICLWLGLGVGWPVVSGCAGHHTNSRTAEMLDDKVIADNVETALHAASPEAFAHVRINVRDSVVRLRGWVPNTQAKAQAAQVAKNVEQVREVHDQLQIRESRRK